MESPTEGLGIRIIVTDDKVYLALFVAFKRLQWESGLDWMKGGCGGWIITTKLS